VKRKLVKTKFGLRRKERFEADSFAACACHSI